MAKLTIEMDSNVESIQDLQQFQKYFEAFVAVISGATVAATQFSAAMEASKVVVDEKVIKAGTTIAESENTVAVPASSPTATDAPSITIKELRDLVGQKVEVHRDIIKFKLTQFGANNVSSLDTSKYEEFHAFLKGL